MFGRCWVKQEVLLLYACHLLWWFRPCGGCAQKSTNKQKSTHKIFTAKPIPIPQP